jgi:hypothetical protein
MAKQQDTTRGTAAAATAPETATGVPTGFSGPSRTDEGAAFFAVPAPRESFTANFPIFMNKVELGGNTFSQPYQVPPVVIKQEPTKVTGPQAQLLRASPAFQNGEFYEISNPENAKRAAREAEAALANDPLAQRRDDADRKRAEAEAAMKEAARLAEEADAERTALEEESNRADREAHPEYYAGVREDAEATANANQEVDEARASAAKKVARGESVTPEEAEEANVSANGGGGNTHPDIKTATAAAAFLTSRYPDVKLKHLQTKSGNLSVVKIREVGGKKGEVFPGL